MSDGTKGAQRALTALDTTKGYGENAMSSMDLFGSPETDGDTTMYHNGEARIAQLRQALVNQAQTIIELRREVDRLARIEAAVFPRRKKFTTL